MKNERNVDFRSEDFDYVKDFKAELITANEFTYFDKPMSSTNTDLFKATANNRKEALNKKVLDAVKQYDKDMIELIKIYGGKKPINANGTKVDNTPTHVIDYTFDKNPYENEVDVCNCSVCGLLRKVFLKQPITVQDALDVPADDTVASLHNFMKQGIITERDAFHIGLFMMKILKE